MQIFVLNANQLWLWAEVPAHVPQLHTIQLETQPVTHVMELVRLVQVHHQHNAWVVFLLKTVNLIQELHHVIASQTLLLHILNLSVPNLDRAFALQVTFTTRQEQFAKKFVEMGYFLICNAMTEM